jgi:hypothetical protein
VVRIHEKSHEEAAPSGSDRLRGLVLLTFRFPFRECVVGSWRYVLFDQRLLPPQLWKYFY